MRHDRISVISGVSVSPRQQRLGLYYQLHPHNIRQAEAVAFLQHLLQHLRGPVIVVWDNGTIHGGDPIRALCRRHPRLRLERFPAYAPELNPDEGVWAHAKRTLANGRPDTQATLHAHLAATLNELRYAPRRLRGCITHSGLPPFLR